MRLVILVLAASVGSCSQAAMVGADALTSAAHAEDPSCPRTIREQTSEVRLMVGESHRQRESDGDRAPSIDRKPSQLYERFAKVDSNLREAESRGCQTFRHQEKDGTSFEQEWQEQQRIELARVAAFEREQRRIAELAQQRDAEMKDAWAKAKKLGFEGVVFDESLTWALDSIVSGEAKMTTASRIVFELGDNDDDFIALQSLGKNAAIYTSKATPAVVMLRNYGDLVVEGSRLTGIRSPYVVIKGLTHYRTAMGTRQAFVVETAW